ncbi:MAG: KGG domain-containing protein [Rhodocyclaceae bacterium]|nr:KGG domain-containing protein [Rhodocyclaceae bacterium]
MTEQHRGGKGNFANDPKRASEAGRKGGQQSGGNTKGSQSGTGSSQKGGQSDRRS